MESVLHRLHWRTLLLYLDDLIVVGPDFQTHLARLEEVLTRLRGAGLKLKPDEGELLQRQVCRWSLPLTISGPYSQRE